MSQNYIFVQTAKLDELPVESMLNSSFMSQQVINESAKLSEIRQKQFIACRYLLAELLNQYFDIPSLPNIVIGDNNRPQFKKTNLPDFNISHSGDMIAVAICTQGKIGLDIELKRPRKNYLAIAKHFFSQQENDWLNQQIDMLSAFWQLWTLRESALKLYAKGVWQMKEMQINMPEQQITSQFAADFYPQHQQLKQIYLSVCCNKAIHLMTIN